MTEGGGSATVSSTYEEGATKLTHVEALDIHDNNNNEVRIMRCGLFANV
jgi:hypothetical protein